MFHAYIYNVPVITKNDLADHINTIRKVLQKLADAVLTVNEEKSFFRCTETKYLGFCVSKNRISTLLFKVENINTLFIPTKVHDSCRFVVLVNYFGAQNNAFFEATTIVVGLD